MSSDTTLEFWLRGAVENVPGLLQPVAHALLQARKEVEEVLVDFPDELLWKQPGSVATVGFHLQHLTGVLDRLFTYARQEQLSTEQLRYLKTEGNPTTGLTELLRYFKEQVDKSIQQLINTDPNSLTQVRGVGRKQIPSTTIGLLFHAAEHTMRHTGQLLVTVKILKALDLSEQSQS